MISDLSNPNSYQEMKDLKPLKPTTTPDAILSSIQFSTYQICCLLSISLVILNEGAEVILLSLLLPILANEWQLTSSQQSVLASSVWIGTFIGVLIAGKVSDHFGRKNPIIITVVFMYISAMWSAYVTSFGELIFVRVIYGILQGLEYTLCLIFLSEILPKEVRGKYMILIGGSWVIGEILVITLGFHYLEGVGSGDWRSMMICAA
jgi:putative MFS transporter